MRARTTQIARKNHRGGKVAMLLEMLQKNRASLIALIVGLFLGWWAIGWGLWPVDYVLGPRNTDLLVATVADAYAVEPNADLAKQRIVTLRGESNDEKLAQSLARLKTAAKGNDKQTARIQQLADGLKITIPTTPAPDSSSGNLLGSIAGLLGVILLVAAVGLIGYVVIRRRSSAEAKPSISRGFTPSFGTTSSAAPMQREEMRGAAPVIEREGVEAALGHFVTTYKLGDDGYDTSFSIETPTGDFLGECGVGIGEVVGEGPQKVTAFEVWLFDKNDIKTVTKVLMSEYAYNNEGIRKKLQSRGDAVMARPGADVVLETGALKVTANVSDMAYGSGGTPQSFFGKLTLELAPTIKAK
jgi:hypothetical protein